MREQGGQIQLARGVPRVLSFVSVLVGGCFRETGTWTGTGTETGAGAETWLRYS